MKPLAIVGALAATAVGAGIWAAIAVFLDLEIGWVAWGIGAMVGGAAYALGGRGPVSGGVAVVLTLVAILAGKVLTIDIVVAKSLGEDITTEEYTEYLGDAREYPGLDADDAALTAFVVAHGFYETGSPQELAEFREIWAPWLDRWKREEPAYDDWRDQEVERRSEIVYSEFSKVDLLKEGLGLFDLIFAFLGISTAFKLAGRPEEDFFSGAGGGSSGGNEGGPTDGPDQGAIS